MVLFRRLRDLQLRASLRDLLAICVVVAVSASCFAAPLPKGKVKPKPTPIVAGAWLMTWGAVKAPAIFDVNGTYCCDWQGTQWRGNWTLAGRLLTVVEWSENTQPIRWTVPLDETLRSDTHSLQGNFRLEDLQTAPLSFQ